MFAVRCHYWTWLVAWMLVAVSTVHAEEILPPASQRFAEAGAEETPDFQKHVSPLLGRLGCNGRACHGSFQGQGGLRLSLFGYDFAADHRALTSDVGDEGASRVDREHTAESLILTKPTLTRDHEGGRRLAANSWEYRMLLRWIEEGASGASDPQTLQTLEIEPNELLLRPGQQSQLRVIARWDGDLSEDVTCLSRFQSQDDAIAEVDTSGTVTVAGQGDTHIIVFYDNEVATVPVLSPRDAPKSSPAEVEPNTTQVDHFITAKLSRLGLEPSRLCSDAEYLRRLSLDLTGTLPTPEEIEGFVADSSSDKRRRKVDELLRTPAYAAWWANWLCDFTGNSPQRQSDGALRYQISVQWREWLHQRLAENVPYDQIVAGIVLARSRSEGQSYSDYAREMSAYLRTDSPSVFADRELLPHYWTRENIIQPEEKALAFAHSFLGIRLQCAQCHKHPFDRWTQDDFRHFAKFFSPLVYGLAPDARDEFVQIATAAGQPADGQKPGAISQEAAAKAEAGEVIAFRELYIDQSKVPTGSLRLLGIDVELDGTQDPRAVILDWMLRRDNPYLARALVNRVWANYFHVGLIEPVDDLNPANPPSNAPLLDYLCAEFVSHNYDLHWLHREIANSLAYQRSWRPNDTNQDDRRNFSRFIPRRLPAEVLYDVWKQATASVSDLTRVREDLTRRSVGELATRLSGTYAQRVFGQPDRLAACDCERSNTPSLLQSIFVQNDPLMHARLNESGWIADVALAVADNQLENDPTSDDLIRQAYLRTVSRPPTAEDLDTARGYLSESETLDDGLRDLVWALFNSKEFLLNH